MSSGGDGVDAGTEGRAVVADGRRRPVVTPDLAGETRSAASFAGVALAPPVSVALAGPALLGSVESPQSESRSSVFGPLFGAEDFGG